MASAELHKLVATLRSAKIVSEATIEDIRAGWEKFAASFFVARNAHEAVSDGETGIDPNTGEVVRLFHPSSPRSVVRPFYLRGTIRRGPRR
jgi:hypothetical protein